MNLSMPFLCARARDGEFHVLPFDAPVEPDNAVVRPLALPPRAAVFFDVNARDAGRPD
jgi:hypothetical protein